jgi:capsule polysaccharide export protein KpsE/RkpR
MLKVSKPRDTKILEIEVTLNEPKLAQSVVQFLAEETVELSRQENTAADREMLDQAEKQTAEAARKLLEAQAGSASFAARAPVAAIQGSIARSADSLATLRPAAVEAEAEAAGIEAQAKQGGDPFATERLPQMRARAAALNQRVDEINRSIDANTAMLSRWSAEKRNADTGLTMAEAAYQAAAARLRDASAMSGTRAERLRVIDPGIVPQRPSFPNLPLNVIAAIFIALVGTFAYLSVAFSLRRKPRLRPVMTRGIGA